MVPTLVIHVGMLWPLDSVAVGPRVCCFSALFRSAGVASMSLTVNVKWHAAAVQQAWSVCALVFHSQTAFARRQKQSSYTRLCVPVRTFVLCSAIMV